MVKQVVVKQVVVKQGNVLDKRVGQISELAT